MAMNFDDAIGGYVTEISEKINETRDEFILESLMPYAQAVESRINKQELERAIRMFYGMENLAEVVRCKDCKYWDAVKKQKYKDTGICIPPRKDLGGYCVRRGATNCNDFCSQGEKGERRKDNGETDS